MHQTSFAIKASSVVLPGPQPSPSAVYLHLGSGEGDSPQKAVHRPLVYMYPPWEPGLTDDPAVTWTKVAVMQS